MKRIAVIFEGNLQERLGVWNAVLNRVKHLRAIADYEVDVFMIHVYDTWTTRLLHRNNVAEKGPSSIVDNGIEIKLWWFNRSFCDALAHHIYNGEPKVMLKKMQRMADDLEGYDLISAHDWYAGQLARIASKRYGVPFFITWHGASIYTTPIHDTMVRRTTIDLLQEANCNFFVSKGLAEHAFNLTDSKFRWNVLYNGVAPQFVRFNNENRMAQRMKKGVADTKVVAYIGRFEEVKNTLLIPKIFSRICQYTDANIKFWAIGKGSEFEEVKQALLQTKYDAEIWDVQTANELAQFMNCVDVLILPSLREGMPLVLLEAISCGANAIATNIKGTREILSDNFMVPLDDNLVESIARRAAQLLDNPEPQVIPEACSWECTAEKENNIYQNYMK